MNTHTQARSGIQRNLRLEDLICQVCHVQATIETDRICEVCKAIGKSAEPAQERGLWDEIQFGKICAKRFIFGLGA